MELVRRTQSLSNMPSLTEAELGQRGKDWQDAFEPVIPMKRLQEVFNRALAAHTTSFPVNGFEIIAAWKAIEGEEAAERTKQRLADPQAFCVSRENHINKIGDVMMQILLPPAPGIVMPCPDCRSGGYHVAYNNLDEKVRLSSVDIVDKLQADLKAKRIEQETEPAERLCIRFANLLGLKHLEAEADAGREKLRHAWVVMMHAANYCRRNPEEQENAK